MQAQCSRELGRLATRPVREGSPSRTSTNRPLASVVGGIDWLRLASGSVGARGRRALLPITTLLRDDSARACRTRARLSASFQQVSDHWGFSKLEGYPDWD